MEDIKVIRVSCGLKHTCFVTAENQLFTMGDNSYGQLGIGPNITRTTAAQKVILFLLFN